VDEAAIDAVRTAVFQVEQRVPRDRDRDGRDHEAIHVLGIGEDGSVATGRLLPDGTIGRVAVLVTHRHRGVGEAVMVELVALARAAGYPRVELGAQVHAVGFYEALGFVVSGDRYVDVGIEHLPMTLDLT
jgi:predicted GNAT family N-acyltransferase